MHTSNALSLAISVALTVCSFAASAQSQSAQPQKNPGYADRYRYTCERPYRGRIRIADRHDLRRVVAGHRCHRRRHRARQAVAVAELPAPGHLRRQRCRPSRHTARSVAGQRAGAGRRQALSHLRAGELQPLCRSWFGAGRSQLAADVGDRPHRGAARWRIGAIRLRCDCRCGQHRAQARRWYRHQQHVGQRRHHGQGRRRAERHRWLDRSTVRYHQRRYRAWLGAAVLELPEFDGHQSQREHQPRHHACRRRQSQWRALPASRRSGCQVLSRTGRVRL